MISEDWYLSAGNEPEPDPDARWVILVAMVLGILALGGLVYGAIGALS